MTHLRKTHLAVVGGGVLAAVLAVAVATSALAAAAASPGSGATRASGHEATLAHHAGRFGGRVLEAAAAYIGIAQDQLRAELKAGKSLAEVAVANGKTRDGLIAALTDAARDGIARLVDHKGVPGAGPKHGHGKHLVGAPFEAAAAYLGLSRADLLARVRAGETLAAVAASIAGKSREGLVAALVADANAKIDTAAAAGRITAERATELKTKVETQVNRLVDETKPPRQGGPKRP